MLGIYGQTSMIVHAHLPQLVGRIPDHNQGPVERERVSGRAQLLYLCRLRSECHTHTFLLSSLIPRSDFSAGVVAELTQKNPKKRVDTVHTPTQGGRDRSVLYG